MEYQKYLEEKNREEQKMINFSSKPPIFYKNIIRIDNPENNIYIREIDSHPDVVIKKGNNYIFKYVKAE